VLVAVRDDEVCRRAGETAQQSGIIRAKVLST
jgi:hypothetical protein